MTRDEMIADEVSENIMNYLNGEFLIDTLNSRDYEQLHHMVSKQILYAILCSQVKDIEAEGKIFLKHKFNI